MLITIPTKKFKAWFNVPELFPRFAFKNKFLTAMIKFVLSSFWYSHFSDFFKKSVLRTTFKKNTQKKQNSNQGGKKPSFGNLIKCIFNIISKSLIGGVRIGIKLYLSIPKTKHESGLLTSLNYGNYFRAASSQGFHRC